MSRVELVLELSLGPSCNAQNTVSRHPSNRALRLSALVDAGQTSPRPLIQWSIQLFNTTATIPILSFDHWPAQFCIYDEPEDFSALQICSVSSRADSDLRAHPSQQSVPLPSPLHAAEQEVSDCLTAPATPPALRICDLDDFLAGELQYT